MWSHNLATLLVCFLSFEVCLCLLELGYLLIESPCQFHYLFHHIGFLLNPFWHFHSNLILSVHQWSHLCWSQSVCSYDQTTYSRQLINILLGPIWLDLSSSFLLSWSGTFLLAINPNTFKSLRLGLTPDQNSSGVIPSSLLVGHIFKIYVVVDTTSPHSSLGRLFPFNILLTMFMIVLFFLSAVPMC